MDDILISLLTFALLILPAIGSAIRKKRMKTAVPENGRQRPYKKNVTFEDILAEIGNDKDNTSEDMARKTGNSVANNVTHEDEIDIIPTNSYEVTADHESRSVPVVSRFESSVEKAISDEHEKPAKHVVKTSRISVVSESQAVADAILQDFDLKRAVIEAEILKPKYEQY